ncbi:hypothetical protein FB45DRAFT_1033520 [Roridomyces roridus]|uniref:F-box domain-containing protein n=1 Tax=Roridomyces roridus TaxID=1738132 RepID=A0AAD7BFY3_9AGAR|nr:hypothetical protein FB45DRAFT_1033520 [Roridomyces roridus]
MHTGAQSAERAITLWLPNEILTQVIQNAPKCDQATLCRVSRLFYGLALPSLNRTVTLCTVGFNVEVLEAFSSALIQNPERADSVRSLTFINGCSSTVPTEDILIQSLTLMRRLEHLSIDDSQAHMYAWELNIEQFLSRHPTITHLRLGSEIGQNVDSADLMEGTLLPKLQYYHGMLRLLGAFSTHSLLALRTSWTLQNRDLVQNLVAQTNPNLSLCIECLFEHQLSDILIQLPARMPQLKKLKLLGWDRMVMSAMSVPDTVDQITAYLTRFECLTYLALNHVFDQGSSAVDNRKALQVWANACPTLRGGGIGEMAGRKVGEQW